METIYMIILGILGVLGAPAVYFIGPAIYASLGPPIPELSENVYKIKAADELDALLSSCTYVVVDFYADWCPPCRAIAPVFSKLADTYSQDGHIAFAKVNVDHVQNVAKRYGVTAMPTFMVFERGAPKGVAVEGAAVERMKRSNYIKFTDDGRVLKVCGADRQALEAVVRALGAKD
ncbi:hypothetical protein E4U55_007811 [Claviceps digitariae]|nr:hypothetical protein E4U55_007811 [Claviceps digitariae]